MAHFDTWNCVYIRSSIGNVKLLFQVCMAKHRREVYTAPFIHHLKHAMNLMILGCGSI
jgi:hypothetical protein